jgi:hypothetical protein
LSVSPRSASPSAAAAPPHFVCPQTTTFFTLRCATAYSTTLAELRSHKNVAGLAVAHRRLGDTTICAPYPENFRRLALRQVDEGIGVLLGCARDVLAVADEEGVKGIWGGVSYRMLSKGSSLTRLGVWAAQATDLKCNDAPERCLHVLPGLFFAELSRLSYRPVGMYEKVKSLCSPM